MSVPGWRRAGVIVRVPLASGLLTGTLSRDDTFPADDHRNFDRDGEAFDRGETVAGLPYEQGLDAVDELRAHVPGDLTMVQTALRWLFDFDAVSTVIPGSTSPAHIRQNAAASDADPLSHQTNGAIRDIYEEYVFDDVRHPGESMASNRSAPRHDIHPDTSQSTRLLPDRSEKVPRW